MRKPILITGSHRSGTTWVGNVLRQVPYMYYIHEPLTPNSITRALVKTEVWYKYYNPEKHYEQTAAVLNDLFRGNYPFKSILHFKNKLPHTDYRNSNGINDNQFDLKYFKWRIAAFLDSKRLKFSGVQENQIIPLIKDPIALTAAEWLHKNWNTKNIILLRHPAAFVSSLKRLNWRFNFDNFTQQPNLVNRFLRSYSPQIESPPTDLVAEAALVWVCLTEIIVKYQKLYPDWVYLRHEDLSSDPINQFKILFDKLKLPFRSKAEEFIQSTTTTINPTEVSQKGKVHQLRRNSRANIKTWQNRLKNNEIKIIKDITGTLAAKFYSDEDW